MVTMVTLRDIKLFYEYECLDCKILEQDCDLLTGYKLKMQLKEGSKKTYCGKSCLIKMRYIGFQYGKGRVRKV